MIYNVFLVLAVLVAGFIFWKRGREEHFTEDILFDGFLISLMGGLVAARLFYVLLHFGEFGWSIPMWINLVSYGGLAVPFGVAAAILFLARFSHTQRWDIFGVLDMWMPGMVAAAAIQQIGTALSGGGVSLTLGSLWLPITPIAVVLLLLMSRYLYWLEYRYRTFSWYKSGQDVAKTGFITALGLIMFGVLFVPYGLVVYSTQPSLSVAATTALFGVSLVVGITLVLIRSRMFEWGKKRR